VLVSDPVLLGDGTLKSCAVVLVAGTATVSEDVSPEEVSLKALFPDEVSPDAALPDEVSVVSDEAMKLSPADDDPASRLLLDTLALSLVPDPESDPEPAVTQKSFDPSLENSHGVPDAGAPPFNVTPVT
jgi:hypothetical protein